MFVLPIRTASACLQLRDDVGVVGRHEVLQDLAAAGGRLALGAEHVLDGDRHAGELAERFAALALGVDGAGLLEGAGFVDVQERFELRVALADAREEGCVMASAVRSPAAWRCSSSVAVRSIMESSGESV